MITSNQRLIRISLPEQRLTLWENEGIIAEFPVSTGANGPGEEMGSGRTPRGWHRVRAKIGDSAPVGAVFRGRRPTGDIYGRQLAERYPNRDWVLTRILWLSGLEPGRNRLGDVDTMRRYIYIHGCPDDAPMGVPRSHGCIRMRNTDIIALFDQVPPGTPVEIRE
uniref:L,D-transpeptidase catalytic domain n=1 Tax=Candidatus Kentrum sp. DK TaxID=2126562 RepID=A0A450T3A3_9GAMM|nr:MAG: L,D-transpeptidase catalytic domain [Candidatus Kentron sp. DK]